MAAAQQLDGRRVWVRHQFELLQRISKQREEDKYTDFTLKSKGKEFRVHRNVLAACSPYFDTLFQTNMMEQQSGTATLNFTSAEVMEELLAYMYSGSLRVQEDMVEELLKTADHLLMVEVKDLCIQYLLEQLDVSNCLAMKALAEVYKADNLLKAANETIRKNVHTVIKREETLDIPLHSVQELLADDLLQVAKEEELFGFLVAWTKRDLPERKDHFPSLFAHIRVTDIPKRYLEEYVKTEELVTESEECQKYIAKETSSSEEESSQQLNARSGKMEEVVMVTGGVSRSPGNEEGTTEMLCYLPRQDTWCQLCPLNYAVTFNAIAALNGKVYVAGGRLWPENRVTSFVSCYSVVENSWTRVRNMSAKRANFALVPCNGCLYAIGGKSERIFLGGSIGEVPVTTVERYNEANHTWSYISSMTKVCSDVEAVATNDHIYLTFGKDQNGTNIAGNGQLPYYNVKTNVWGKVSATCPVSMSRGMDDENQILVSFLRDSKIHFLGLVDGESATDGFYQYYDIAADQWTAVTIDWPGNSPGIFLPRNISLYTPVHNGNIFICCTLDNENIGVHSEKTYYRGHMLTLKDKLLHLERTYTTTGVSSIRPAPTSSACHLDIPQKHLRAFAKDVTMSVSLL
ncbi:KLHL11 [Branchiostoma lanceolatum]|nr:KLHL11 [Branchiostoma lanceolatum]